MNDLATRWFGRLHRVTGAMAYGLRTNDRQIFSRTWNPQFSEAALNDFWQRLEGIAQVALPAGEKAESLRWIFHDHLVTAVARPDNTMYFILRAKDARSVDESGLERLLNEFRGLRSE
ncbi:MAG TPA: hypothetical protein VK530_10830 [Candidatus Acidoferrum sp.]|nr:hypothetical protein [Candidatus Acidoferrum sp.]